MFTESPGQSLGLHLSAQFSKPFPHVFDKSSEHQSLGFPCFVPSAERVEIPEFSQFQDQLEWHYPSFYSNKCSTEAVWSFPVVSKLPCAPCCWAGLAQHPLPSPGLWYPCVGPGPAGSGLLGEPGDASSCWCAGNTVWKWNVESVQSLTQQWLPANLTPWSK